MVSIYDALSGGRSSVAARLWMAHGQADGRGGEAVVAQDSPDLTALERAFGHRLALLKHHTRRGGR